MKAVKLDALLIACIVSKVCVCIPFLANSKTVLDNIEILKMLRATDITNNLKLEEYLTTTYIYECR